VNKREIKDFLLYNCPDIPALRRFLAQKKVAELKSRLMTEQEIQQGEKDWETRKKLVKKYVALKSKYAENANGKIDMLLRNAPCFQGNADLEKARVDMQFCRFAYGFEPDEYVFFHLEEKSAEERRDYISNLDRIIAAFRMNDFSDMQILKDKWKTYTLLKPYYGRDAILLQGRSDYNKFLSFIQKHPVFIKKRLNLGMGESVELYDVTTCGMTCCDLFKKLIKEGKLILEEKIIQSKITEVFNESSVNTARFFTFNTKNGIRSMGFVRTGRPGAVVDNAGSGGVFAAFDVQTGIVVADGSDELGNRYRVHPDSGVPYIGFQLPEWEKAVALCYEAVEYLPRVKYIGWDLAYTDQGWVIVEANMSGQFVQQACIGGLKEELNAIMKEMDLIV